MNYIHWLEITRTAKYAKHLSHHYILKIDQKFMIFTTTPSKITGAPCKYVSPTNIIGEPRDQYIVDHIHIVNPEIHKISIAEHGAAYCAKYSSEILPLLQKMQPLIEKLT